MGMTQKKVGCVIKWRDFDHPQPLLNKEGLGVVVFDDTPYDLASTKLLS